jgi:hypothetical protein
MFETFRPGDVVEIKTQWPWATREIEIVRHVEGMYYIARALPPFSRDVGWKESPAEGERFFVNTLARKVR